jgi:transposase
MDQLPGHGQGAGGAKLLVEQLEQAWIAPALVRASRKVQMVLASVTEITKAEAEEPHPGQAVAQVELGTLVGQVVLGRRLTTVPGVGAVVALSHGGDRRPGAARQIEGRGTGARSHSEPLPIRRTDRPGPITKAGDARARVALFEAEPVLTRVALWLHAGVPSTRVGGLLRPPLSFGQLRAPAA